MAIKLTCPACDSHTSAVWRAAMGIDVAGRLLHDPDFTCPHCGAAFPGSLTFEAYERDALEHSD
ncbi:hypothetical protein SEA_CHEESETOUCH_48 [Gordonia phage CheeseTouch]